MKTEHIQIDLYTGRQAARTLGLAKQARVWHMQDLGVAAIFDDATEGEELNPKMVLAETRRKNLELARENAVLKRENKEQSEEISQLMDIASNARDELGENKAELASVKAELDDSWSAVAEMTQRRVELQSFWALATPEARLLLVTAHLKGPVDVVEVASQATNNSEILEAICRLRAVGFIKFHQRSVYITVTGEEFATRLGFVKS